MFAKGIPPKYPPTPKARICQREEDHRLVMLRASRGQSDSGPLPRKNVPRVNETRKGAATGRPSITYYAINSYQR